MAKRRLRLADLMATSGNALGAGPSPILKQGPLAERFVVPPFSVLDARQGYWQSRKRAWLGLGIRSELGRGEQPGDEHARRASRPSAQYHGDDGDTREGRDGGEYKGGDAWLASGRKLQAVPGGVGENGVYRDKGQRYADAKTYHSGGPGELGADMASRDGAPIEPAYKINEWVRELHGEDYTGNNANQTGTSIFDPVLCEVMYRWFAPPDGLVLDPFAGGSVRGLVAAALGRRYVGIDLRPEQAAANYEQKADFITNGLLSEDTKLAWLTGDARDVKSLTKGVKFDFVLTCPPYFNLELYSYDPKDLSNATSYGQFQDAYYQIIADTVSCLKPNRFAVYVVGNIRGPNGSYIDLVGDTIRAFGEAGASLYNEAVLVTAVGSLPLRLNNQFYKGRKLGRTHQNVLVFCTGDGIKAAEAVPYDT